MPEIRECAVCGDEFVPQREHARFCSARCRMAWNHEHAGVAAAPAAAIDWSVSAMAEAAARLTSSVTWDPAHLSETVSDAVWWVTLVDATLVRYHPRNYEGALSGRRARRHATEQTLEGLRYVRNQLGKSAEPASLIERGSGDGPATEWIWRPLPEPDLAGLGSRARKWELSRYRAYQEQLAGHDITETFTWCAEFLTLAAGLAGDPGLPRAGAPGDARGPAPVTAAARPENGRDARASDGRPAGGR
jgi:endogenous inhibitor of DNA gyrase (YacG/DUF329 family)